MLFFLGRFLEIAGQFEEFFSGVLIGRVFGCLGQMGGRLVQAAQSQILIAEEQLIIGSKRLVVDRLLECFDLVCERFFLFVEAARVVDGQLVLRNCRQGCPQDGGGVSIVAVGKQGLAVCEGQDDVLGGHADGLAELGGCLGIFAGEEEVYALCKAAVGGCLELGCVLGGGNPLDVVAYVIIGVSKGIFPCLCLLLVGGGVAVVVVCVIGVLLDNGRRSYDGCAVPVIGMAAVPVVAAIAIFTRPPAADAHKDMAAMIMGIVIGESIAPSVGYTGQSGTGAPGECEGETGAAPAPAGVAVHNCRIVVKAARDIGARPAGGDAADNFEFVVAGDADSAVVAVCMASAGGGVGGKVPMGSAGGVG